MKTAMRLLLGLSIAGSLLCPNTAAAKIYRDTVQINGKDVKVWKIKCTNREQDNINYTTGRLKDAVALGVASCGRGNFSLPPENNDIILPGPTEASKLHRLKSSPKVFGTQNVTTTYNNVLTVPRGYTSKNVTHSKLNSAVKLPNNPNLNTIIYGNGDYKKIKIGDDILYRIKCTNIDDFFYMDGASTKSQVEGEINASCVEAN